MKGTIGQKRALVFAYVDDVTVIARNKKEFQYSVLTFTQTAKADIKEN